MEKYRQTIIKSNKRLVLVANKNSLLKSSFKMTKFTFKMASPAQNKNNNKNAIVIKMLCHKNPK